MAATTPQQLVAPCLQKIFDGATGRKYATLRSDAQVRTLHDASVQALH